MFHSLAQVARHAKLIRGSGRRSHFIRRAQRNYSAREDRRMTDTNTTREEDLRRLLTDAIEVQLAALKAGISFWSEWIEQTSEFVQSATKALSTINAEDQQAKDVLLELVDAGRASVRSMTEIPRHTATRFIEELDRLEKKKEGAAQAGARGPRSRAKTGSSAGRSAATKARGPSRPKRAGRVKA